MPLVTTAPHSQSARREVTLSEVKLNWLFWVSVAPSTGTWAAAQSPMPSPGASSDVKTYLVPIRTLLAWLDSNASGKLIALIAPPRQPPRLSKRSRPGGANTDQWSVRPRSKANEAAQWL